MVQLNDHHHIFIQSMFSRRAAPVDTWKAIWKKSAAVLRVRVSDDQFEPFWRQINESIEEFGFRIATIVDHGIGPLGSQQHSPSAPSSSRKPGRRWMALVNTRSDETAKLGTELTPPELSFFKKVLDSIILAPNYRFCLSVHDAIRASTQLSPPMKKSDAQNLLAVLLHKDWLSLSSSGYYTLSIRSQLELQSYLTETYNEEDLPPTCASCREIVMKGYKCVNPECPKALHEICEKRNTAKSGRCPACQAPWSPTLPIGENVQTAPRPAYEKETLNTPDSQPSQSRRKRRNLPTSESEDD